MSNATNSDYRHRMVRSLLTPNSISDSRLLHALEEVDRHFFYPRNSREEVYSESVINSKMSRSSSRRTASFLSTIRLINFAKLCAPHKILIVGAETGFTAALCSFVVSEIVALEQDEDFYDHLKKNLSISDYPHISTVKGQLILGYAAKKTYDRILIFANVESVPKPLFHQLSKNGRLLCFKSPSRGLGYIAEYMYDELGIQMRKLFEASAPFWSEFTEKEKFML